MSVYVPCMLAEIKLHLACSACYFKGELYVFDIIFSCIITSYTCSYFLFVLCVLCFVSGCMLVLYSFQLFLASFALHCINCVEKKA